MKWHILKGLPAGQWYFHLRARNGRIVCQSEGYNRRAAAVRICRRINPDFPIVFDL